jgi:hypothetical protein
VSVRAQGRAEASEPGVAGASRLSTQADVAPAQAPVREAWTSEVGARTIFAAARLDLRPGGACRRFFPPEAVPGRQGGEGAVMPAVPPMAMLSFTWNAPPDRPAVVRSTTFATVGLHAVGSHATRPRRTQDGWGRGDEGDRAQACIRRAGRPVVRPQLCFRSEHGPLDEDQRSGDLQPAAPGGSSMLAGPSG